MLPRDASQSFRIVCPRLFASEERPHTDCGFSTGLRAERPVCAPLPRQPVSWRALPSAANINPYPRRALWGPNGPKMYCAATDQQSAQVRVTSFGYAQLWIALSALIAPRTQAGVGAHIAHIFKTLWIFDLQNKIERSQHSYSRDLLQPKRLRIFCSGHNVDLTLEHVNARAQLGQRLHAWVNHLRHPFGQSLHGHLMKTFARRITHCVTQAL